MPLEQAASSSETSAWSLPWPLEGTPSTIIRGCCDVIYRDGDGRWRPLIVSPAAARKTTRASSFACCSQPWPPSVLDSYRAVRDGGSSSNRVRCELMCKRPSAEVANLGHMVNAFADMNRADAGRVPSWMSRCHRFDA